jgi:hypothetical protein
MLFRILQRMTLKDFGFNTRLELEGFDIRPFTPKYVPIHECDDFHIGIFCLLKGTHFPLHDHPEMVLSLSLSLT